MTPQVVRCWADSKVPPPRPITNWPAPPWQVPQVSECQGLGNGRLNLCSRHEAEILGDVVPTIPYLEVAR